MVLISEQIGNAVTTTITAGVSTSDTSITVESADGFPTSAPYRIKIGSEVILVTAGAGTTSWTVTRAQEGTTADAFRVPQNVSLTWTVGARSAFNEFRFSTDTRAERPSEGNQGRLYFTQSPGWYIFQDDTTEWKGWGPVVQMVEPFDVNFGWVNQGIGFAEGSSQEGGIFIHTTPPSTIEFEEVRLRTQDLTFEDPTSAPYTVTTAFLPLLSHTDKTSCGIIMRENSSEKFIFFRLMYDTTSSISKNDLVISLDKYTDEDTLDSNYKTLSAATLLGSVIWFRMADDNADLIFSVSNDGKNFIEIDSQTRTDFLAGGPDEVGFAINTNNTSGSAAMTLLSWEKVGGIL